MLELAEPCNVPGVDIRFGRRPVMPCTAPTPAQRHFLIFSYPRSRTSWLSAFLTTGQSFCHHEASISGSAEGILERFRRTPKMCVGNCDSAMSVVGEELYHALPDAPVVFIHRDFHESAHSLSLAAKRDYEAIVEQMEPYRRAVEHLKRTIKNALHVDWTDLSDEEACRTLWLWLKLPEPWQPERFRLFSSFQIQPLPEVLINA